MSISSANKNMISRAAVLACLIHAAFLSGKQSTSIACSPSAFIPVAHHLLLWTVGLLCDVLFSKGHLVLLQEPWLTACARSSMVSPKESTVRAAGACGAKRISPRRPCL